MLHTWLENKPKLKNRLARLIGNPQDVDDLLQDLFVKVYRNRESFPLDYAAQYLMKSASNLARDYLRKVRGSKPVGEVQFVDLQTPETVYVVGERSEFYRKILELELERLSEEQREALLAYCFGDNLTEAVRRKGVPYTTFRSRRDAAMKILRDRLSSASGHKTQATG